MSFAIALAALGFLMLVAYRGYSVILFAPIAALGAVLLTDPMAVLPVYTGLFMDKMVGFVKLYFPVFMLGAVFGKLIELSGFSRAIVSAVIGMLGRERAILSIVLVCNLLTYGGVSLFVVAFAVYPFAAEVFRQSDIPKRLIPGDHRAGRLHLHDGCAAGHAADPEHHPDHLLRHRRRWAAPILGVVGAIFIFIAGMAYLDGALRQAAGARRRLRHRPSRTSRSRRARAARHPGARDPAAGRGRRR